ncbi:MAG TPA: hypothetical protein VHJ20_18420 [Polyangia bacterium]|nr:hypothetical protein [Polyangia bacterium]
MTRATFRTTFLSAALLAATTLGAGCADETATGEPRVRVVKNADVAPEVGGIPPDKQADIQLMLQQRDPSTLKCYEDVLNDKHDRAFKGTVIVLISLRPSGDSSKASAKVIGGTLNNDEVSSCLVEKLVGFEYPAVPHDGTMQYTYTFQPAY